MPTLSNVAGPTRAAGTRLGRYVLLVPIGTGGMGQVWIAEQAAEHAFRRMVALKVIRSEHAADAEFRRMFLTEARVASRLSHANVVECIDLGEEGAQLYQVMEYVEGDSLSQLLLRAATAGDAMAPASIVFRIVVDALRGLHAVHETTDEDGVALGCIHRDVSPHNILVGTDGVARIADFGIAKLHGSFGNDTAVGQIKGKPGYMSPEQAAGFTLDRRSDVYAMGIVAWEALSGARLARLAGRRADQPPLRPDLDPRVLQTISRALAFEAEDRFASAESMADVLEATGVCGTTKEVADWVKQLAGSALDAKRQEARRVARALGPIARGPNATSIENAAPKDNGPSKNATSFTSRDTVGARLGHRPALAVLPFRYRGPAEDEQLGECFSDEVIDVLSQTPGLRVFASGAVQRFRDDRDPETIGRALGAEVIVDGTLQRASAQLRVAVRLVDAASGVQTWSETFTGSVADSFRLQETVSRHIAEALRVELSVRSTGTAVTAEAVELCLRARRKLRVFRVLGPDGALELLERCLVLAPDLSPAIASYAIAAVRAWFVPDASTTDAAEARARAAVSRALADAPAVAESQLAAGLLALHLGEFKEAVAKLGAALDIAPHYADALTALGAIECETGLGERGLPRLTLAWELSPSLVTAYALAYDHAIHGRRGDFDAVIGRSVELRDATGLVVLDMRVAGWQNDLPRIRKALDRLQPSAQDRERFETYGRTMLGEVGAADAEAYFERVVSMIRNSRMRTLFLQLAAEVFGHLGNVELGASYVRRAADGPLLDLEWLDRCPPLESLRSSSGFRDAREIVSRRARSLREE